ncbi:MAG: hypothetical protein ACKODZ_11535, partial [Verrucomicrobiota bacterium]
GRGEMTGTFSGFEGHKVFSLVGSLLNGRKYRKGGKSRTVFGGKRLCGQGLSQGKMGDGRSEMGIHHNSMWVEGVLIW